MSLCKETGISYLTRTEHLTFNRQSGVILVKKALLFSSISRTENLRLSDGCDVVLAEMPVMYAEGANLEAPRVRGFCLGLNI